MDNSLTLPGRSSICVSEMGYVGGEVGKSEGE